MTPHEAWHGNKLNANTRCMNVEVVPTIQRDK